MATAVRSIAARLVPALGRNRDRDRGVAASRMGGISRRQRLGDVVRRVDCGFSRQRDRAVGRGAACRDGFVASRRLCARDCAVFAGVVDDAGHDRAGECGVLGQRVLATWCSVSGAGEGRGPVLG